MYLSDDMNYPCRGGGIGHNHMQRVQLAFHSIAT